MPVYWVLNSIRVNPTQHEPRGVSSLAAPPLAPIPAPQSKASIVEYSDDRVTCRPPCPGRGEATPRGPIHGCHLPGP
jgi:hypothetical protein